MLIIEIAVGVFLGGMGLWLFVSHRDKKKKTEQDKRQEQLEFSAAERYITERFKTLSLPNALMTFADILQRFSMIRIVLPLKLRRTYGNSPEDI